MSTITPAAAYWAAVLPASGDLSITANSAVPKVTLTW